MSKSRCSGLAVLLLLASSPLISQTTSKTNAAAEEWKPIETAMGRAGAMQPGDVYKIVMPRKDLNVTVEGTPIRAGLALGSWVAFKKMGNETMVMGDLVLTEDEVEPVMLKLQEEGIEESALHNHLLHESPRIMYMHIAGHGDGTKLATALHDAIALTKTPGPSASAPSKPTDYGFDTSEIDSILGHKGKDNGGIYQVGVPRAEKITEDGMGVPPSMGTATSINFQPTGGGKAAITGDFVLLGKEVNPAIRALRQNGIEVTAIHSHMLTEEPRLFFMHYWANDNALKLAKGLKAALDQTNSAK